MLLALDQATSKTGYSIWENHQLVESGVLKASSKLCYEGRLTFMKNEILNLLYKFDIDKILIEGIQLEQLEDTSKDISVDTFRKLAHLQGILIQIFYEKEVDYEIISPSVWKSKIGIFTQKRKEQKQFAKDYVQSNFKKVVSEDEADAICIGASQVVKEELAW